MYDAQLAHYLAAMCDKSYKESSLEVNNIQVMVLADEVRTIIVFRGTEIYDLRDIQTDIAVKLKNGVHEGFLTAWDSIKLKLQELLFTQEIEKDVPLYLTGHSLGGALAVISSKDIDGWGFNLKEVYTFGSPRVSTRQLESQIPCPIYRVVNENDPIPRLPPALLGYRHIGELHYLTKMGKILINPGIFRTEVGFFATLFLKFRGLLHNHRLQEYLKKLQNLR